MIKRVGSIGALVFLVGCKVDPDYAQFAGTFAESDGKTLLSFTDNGSGFYYVPNYALPGEFAGYCGSGISCRVAKCDSNEMCWASLACSSTSDCPRGSQCSSRFCYPNAGVARPVPVELQADAFGSFRIVTTDGGAKAVLPSGQVVCSACRLSDDGQLDCKGKQPNSNNTYPDTCEWTRISTMQPTAGGAPGTYPPDAGADASGDAVAIDAAGLRCTKASDCDAGEHCCLAAESKTTCSSSCPAGTTVCSSQADCSDSEICDTFSGLPVCRPRS